MPYMRESLPSAGELEAISQLTQFNLDREFITFYQNFSGYDLTDAELYLDVLYQTEGAIDIDNQEMLIKIATWDDIQRLWQHMGPRFLQHFAEHFRTPPDVIGDGCLLPFAESDSGVLYLSVSGPTRGKLLHADNGDFGIGLVSCCLNKLSNMLANEQPPVSGTYSSQTP